MLNLKDVTLVAVNTVCHELTDLAIKDCLKHANFGDVKVFSDKPRPDSIQISPFASLKEAGDFTVNKLPEYIRTSHVLFIHWDSWIIDPEMWTDDFLKYDYIGAPWWYNDEYNVGNSGFCIRSKRLLDFMANNADFPISMPEDHTLCRTYRRKLPQFTWAPEHLAIRFSFERSRPDIASRHFGFHGLFNWPFVLPPKELAVRMELARESPYVMNTGMLNEINELFEFKWQRLRGRVITG